MTKYLLTFLIAMIISLPVMAGKVAIDKNSSHYKAAEELVQITTPRDTIEKMMDQISEPAFAPMLQQIPCLPEEALKDFSALFDNLVSVEELFNFSIETIYEYLSEEEIKDLLAFYSTKTGKKSIEIMPKISAKSSEFVMNKMALSMPEIQKETVNIINKYVNPDKTCKQPQ